MANENRSRQRSENPDPQKDSFLGNNITLPQDPQTLPNRLPKSLVACSERKKRHLLIIQYAIKLCLLLSPACNKRYPKISEYKQ
jgi:hypothetical protein